MSLPEAFLCKQLFINVNHAPHKTRRILMRQICCHHILLKSTMLKTYDAFYYTISFLIRSILIQISQYDYIYWWKNFASSKSSIILEN